MDTQDNEVKNNNHTYKKIYVNFMKQISPFISCFFCLICVASLFTTTFGPVIYPCILCTLISSATTQLQDGKTFKKLDKLDELDKLDKDLKK